jgi:ABC-type nitrate/sulfonate/bicarbonate transport system permease component
MSWLRAVLTSAAAVAISIGLLVYVPNLIVTHAGGSRSLRVTIATISFFVSLIALSAALRNLQKRHIL